jgi:hypothetical protein
MAIARRQNRSYIHTYFHRLYDREMEQHVKNST